MMKKIVNNIDVYPNGIFYTFFSSEDIQLFYLDRDNYINIETAGWKLYNSDKQLITEFSNINEYSLLGGQYYLHVEGSGSIDHKVGLKYAGHSFSDAMDIDTDELDTKGYFFYSHAKDIRYGASDLIEYPGAREAYYKLKITKHQLPLTLRINNRGSRGSGKLVYLITVPDLKNPQSYVKLAEGRFDSMGYFDNIWSESTNNGEIITTITEPGEYYIVAEGYRSTNLADVNNLTITTVEGFYNKQVEPLSVHRNSGAGTTQAVKMSIGDKKTFEFDTSTSGYYNYFGYKDTKIKGYQEWVVRSNSKEAYHKITLDKPMDIVLHHAGSELKSTWIHVQTEDNAIQNMYKLPMEVIASAKNESGDLNVPDLSPQKAYVELKNLPAGSYIIVSEGDYYGTNKYLTNTNGKMKLTIEAKIPTTLARMMSVPIIEQKTTSIFLTPNPASSMVDLVINTNTDNIDGTYQIIRIAGGLVQKGKLKEKRTSLEISNLSRGVYIVHVIINGENVSERLIVK